MKRNFSLAISFATIVATALNSLALAGQPAHIAFTTDAPCAVTVLVIGYTDPANIPGQTASGVTPWQLDVYPSTSVTFFYPASVVCNGTTYNYVSAFPNSPLTSGAEGDTTTVTGHYVLPDTTPPVWTVPGDFSVDATSSSGAVVTYIASASDPDDAVSSQSCSPASGATFALGTTTVNCTATDTHHNTGTASFNVRVMDTTPPALTLPSDMNVDALNASGAVVSFVASANDLVDGSVAITCSPASDSLFPFGTTTVNCSATDSHNNTGTGSFTVTVVDNDPPILTLPADITINALNASGAVVDFTVSANDQIDGPVVVNCAPDSGSMFPLGTTVVNCSAIDSHNNTGTGSFNVTVVDNDPPVLTLPADITVNALDASGAVVNFAASANDLIDGPVVITCLPASGSLFPLGPTTVNCSATDSHNNTGTGSFNVTVVDNTPPVLTLPSNITVNAINASGAPVSFTVSANDLVDGLVAVTCSPVSGSTFPLGTTTVNCSATDSHNNTGTGSFTVTVVDTNSPTLSLPADIIVEALNASGAVVNFTVSANDLIDGPVAVICSPASGSLFPLGITTVNCSATDSHNNTSTGSFTVTVVDTASPVLALPADMTVEALNASGEVVNFVTSANDLVDGPVVVTCSPASGSIFPLGTTTVNCSAIDLHSNNASGSFNVTVVMVMDTTPPVLTLPANMIVEALSASGTVVNFETSANDLVDGPVAVTCLPASGSIFSLGTTTVNCSAIDSHNNTGTGSFSVTVVDTTPPALTLPTDMIVTALNAFGAPVSFVASANDLVDGPVTVTCSPVSGSLFPIGLTTVNCSTADSYDNSTSGSFNVAVQYAAAGTNCRGVPGHQILQPINADGSSVFNAGRTVPAKFRVCGADGVSIGTDGVVSSFRLIQIISDGSVSNVDEAVASTSSDTEFRSGNQQWIFNINTRDLTAGNTYVYLITLNDGSAIQFQFMLN